MYKVLCVEISLGKCVVRLPKWHFFLARAETGAREKLSYGGGARKITAIFNPPPSSFFQREIFIIGNDYVRMYVTLVDSSWVVVAGVLTGVDFSVRTSSS